MQRQNFNEQAAHEKLRKAAMDKGLRLSEVAHPSWNHYAAMVCVDMARKN